MMIIENDKLLSDETSIVVVMNNYLVNIPRSSNQKDSTESKVDNTSSNIRHSVQNPLFINRVSVNKRENNKREEAGNEEIYLQPVATEELKKIIMGLDFHETSNDCILIELLQQMY